MDGGGGQVVGWRWRCWKGREGEEVEGVEGVEGAEGAEGVGGITSSDYLMVDCLLAISICVCLAMADLGNWPHPADPGLYHATVLQPPCLGESMC